MVIGRHDDALAHLREARDLAERFDDAWLAPGSRCSWAPSPSRRTGWTTPGRSSTGLELSLATSSPRNVSMSLVALARLAVAEADFERAAVASGRPTACTTAPA